MAWLTVNRDLSKQEQVTTTYSLTNGAVTRKVIYTYIAVADLKTSESAATCDGASDGTTTIPICGQFATLEDGNVYTVVQTIPKRTGPTSYENQVTFEVDFTPAQSNDKWNINVTFSGQDYSQDCYQDKDGKAIVNSANQSFDPTLKHTFSDEKISISYQTTTEQSADFTSVRGKVNDSSITLTLPGISRTFDTRTIRCDDAEQSSSTPMSDATPTFKVSLNFTVRADGFVDHVLDQGFYTSDPSTGELVQIKDKNHELLSAPVMLDGSGQQLGAGADPVFLDFKIEDEADFTSAFTGLS